MNRRARKPAVARCVECYSRVHFDKEPDLGQVVVCRECGTRLEVVYLNPIELDWMEEGAIADMAMENDYQEYDYDMDDY